MRPFQRAVATTVAGLAFAAAGIAGAGTAHASPEDGKGCVGTPAIPASYLCVISTTPENVVPTVSVTNVPVTVPTVCYFLDCTGARTIDVPVPGVTPRSGVVAVLWHQGRYIPIGTGTVSDGVNTVYAAIDLASGIANGAVTTAGQTVTYAANLANGAIATAYGIAGSGIATAVALANQYAGLAVSTATWAAEYAGTTADWAVAYAGQTVANVETTVNNEVDAIKGTVRDIVNGLPSLQEIRDALVQWVDEQSYPVREAIDNVVYWIQDCIRYSCQVA